MAAGIQETINNEYFVLALKLGALISEFNSANERAVFLRLGARRGLWLSSVPSRWMTVPSARPSWTRRFHRFAGDFNAHMDNNSGDWRGEERTPISWGPPTSSLLLSWERGGLGILKWLPPRHRPQINGWWSTDERIFCIAVLLCKNQVHGCKLYVLLRITQYTWSNDWCLSVPLRQHHAEL